MLDIQATTTETPKQEKYLWLVFSSAVNQVVSLLLFDFQATVFRYSTLSTLKHQQKDHSCCRRINQWHVRHSSACFLCLQRCSTLAILKHQQKDHSCLQGISYHNQDSSVVEVSNSGMFLTQFTLSIVSSEVLKLDLLWETKSPDLSGALNAKEEKAAACTVHLFATCKRLISGPLYTSVRFP